MNYVNYKKLKILKVIIFIDFAFLSFLFKKKSYIYIKMSKNLSGKYCQENIERSQKKARERYKNRGRYKNFSEDEK